MKQMTFFLFVIIITGLSSCDSTTTKMQAKGAPYEIVVVMDNEIWNSPTGFAVKEELITPIPYLPQEESTMRYTYSRPNQFGGYIMNIRNVLVVSIDKSQYTKVSLLKQSDVWAYNQSVAYLNAPDVSMLETYLSENKGIIIKHFTNEEMRRAGEFMKYSYSQIVMDNVKSKFGITLNAPEEITKMKDGEDCLWFSNDAAIGRMDLLIYSFPFTDKNTFTLDYLIAKRDSVARIMVPGSFEGTYMSTEKRVVDYFSSSLNGKYCGVVRGLWRMEGGDMMGGPFVSYARVDEQNQRVIVTEGFVYEPKKEKKNYIRRLEAALQTTRFPNEQGGTFTSVIKEEKNEEEKIN